jgi:Ca2+-binding EF-hand superfamily protein
MPPTAVALLALAATSTATNITSPACGGRVGIKFTRKTFNSILVQVWCDFVGRFVFAELMETSSQAIEGSNDLSAVFIQLADTNKNNQVNFQEFLDFTEGYIRRAFSAIDSDRNNLVSKDEAEGAVTTVKFGLIESILSEMFSLADLDGDGQLSTKDLPMGKKNKLDTNKDGAVSIQELLGHPVIFFPRPIQSVYKVLDSDKDETICKKEFTNFINFIGRLVNVLDANSDCSVSLDEALQALDGAGLPKVNCC